MKTPEGNNQLLILKSKSTSRAVSSLFLLAVMYSILAVTDSYVFAQTNELATPDNQTTHCDVDRQAMLKLDFQAFDQDFDGGWRPLSQREGCVLVAADLIRDYREHHNSTRKILFWHEGQLRANVGEYEQAVKLFDLTWRNPNEDAFGWNHYVQASIAFLQKDKAALLQARETLAALPKPDDFQPVDPKGRLAGIEWPYNLNVVDRLIECFDYSYKQAYSGCQSESD